MRPALIGVMTASPAPKIHPDRVSEYAAAGWPMVRFARSGLEARWEPDCVTLLGFARALGLDPNASCSQGMCGCCAAKIISGEVEYLEEPLHGEIEGGALLCCTIPAKKQPGGVLVFDI